jgi:GT2 family glycosyltransferase
MKDEKKALGPLVGIVILTWNDNEKTEECVRSCLSITYDNFKIILVDNNSEEKYREKLRNEFKDIELLVNKENLGYAEGNNAGINEAIKFGAQYVLILNNDITISNGDMLGRLVCILENDPELIAIAPKVMTLNSEGKYRDNQNDSAFYGRLRRMKVLPRIENDSDRNIRYSSTLSGCAFLMGASYLEKTGGFNKAFFMYGDEDELLIRAQLNGYRVACSTSDIDIVFHHHCKGKKFAAWKSYLMTRNKVILADTLIREKPIKKFIFIAIIILLQLRYIVLRIVEKDALGALSAMRGMFAGWSMRPNSGGFSGNLKTKWLDDAMLLTKKKK